MARAKKNRPPKVTAQPLVKRIVTFEESSPESEPLFINHVQVSHHGFDVFIDVGVIALDDVILPDNERPPETRFLVLERLAMSVLSLVGLQYQIDEILKELERKGQNVSQMQAQIRALAARMGQLINGDVKPAKK